MYTITVKCIVYSDSVCIYNMHWPGVLRVVLCMYTMMYAVCAHVHKHTVEVCCVIIRGYTKH